MADGGFDYRSEAFAFTEDVDRTFDPVEIVQRILRVTRSLGFDGLSLGGMPAADERFETLVLVRSLPEEWRKRYFARRYFAIDPVIRRLKDAVAPFEVGLRDYEFSENPRVGEVMEGRRAFGQIHAFVVPVRRQGGKGYVWMSGGRPELPPEAKPALHLMALYAFQRIDSLIAPYRNRGLRLTLREREVLTWVAAGKTSWEIGEILGIAKRTVDEHTRMATAKLGASNRTHAVAVAIRHGAISI